jgi:hypothetical protein
MFFLTSCQGPAGQSGKSGIKSFTFNLGFNDWLEYGTPEFQGYNIYTTVAVPELTEDILNNGMVLVYGRGGSANGTNFGAWIQLPYTNIGGNFIHTERYEIFTGGITITHADTDGLTGKPTNYEVKVVIAPREGLIAPDVDLKDFAAVANYLGLEVE